METSLVTDFDIGRLNRRNFGDRIAVDGGIDQPILCFLFVGIMILYGAIGRDVFYNRLYMTKDNVVDPIGAVLPYLRIMFCFISIFYVMATGGIQWAWSRVPYYFLPFALFSLASFFWSVEPKEAFRNAFIMCLLWIALPMLMFRMGLVLATRCSLYIIAWICILSCFVALAFPHIGIHDGREIAQSSHTGRWRGIFAHKNMLGPWAAYGSVFLFTHAELSPKSFLFLWLARISALICLVMAKSATGVVAACLLICSFVFFRSIRTVGLATTAVYSFISVIVFAVFYIYFGDILFDLLGRDSTFTGRTELWAFAWGYIWQHPLLGLGYQLLGGTVFTDRVEVVFGQALGPESGYLSLLLDSGFIGASLFFISVLISLRNGVEWMPFVRSKDRACIEFMLSLIFVSLFQAFSESNVLICTGFDGVLSFCGFFGLMALPKSPISIFRGEFRLAKHRLPMFIKSEGTRSMLQNGSAEAS
jgi:O-antigen ligase